jgi:hypothetical protein
MHMLIVKVPCTSPYRIPDIDMNVKRIADTYGLRLVGSGFGFGYRDNEIEVPTNTPDHKLTDLKRAITRSFPGVAFATFPEEEDQ